MPDRTALVAGATGLVGGFCLKHLIADPDYTRVIALVRRPLEISHSKLSIVLTDFDSLPTVKDKLVADDVFCALGTTSAATTDRSLYERIDVHYPAELARLTRESGARQFLMVTALGANSNSSQWYLQLKGKTEQLVAKEEFQSLHFFRPSFIAGRTHNVRTKEKLALATLNFWRFLFFGSSRRFLPLDAELIARSMIAAAKLGIPGRHVYNRLDMLQLLGMKP